MSSIVVLGAGPIGAAVTYHLAATDVVRRVVLIDQAAAVAQGLALDIQQSGSIHGSATRVDGTSDLGAVVGAAVVVVADRHGTAGEWSGDQGLAQLAAVRGLNPGALVVCAGPSQSDLVEVMVREHDADRRTLVASAPDALRHAMRALTALEADAAPRDVSLAVVGRPPRDLFVPWEGASVGGSTVSDVLPPPVIARLDRQLQGLWPPGPHSLGAAAADVARRWVARAPGWSCLFLVPPIDHDRRVRGAAVPAAFGRDGVRPMWPVLTSRNRVRLESLLST